MIPGLRITPTPGTVAYISEIEPMVVVVEAMGFLTPSEAKRERSRERAA